MRGERERRAERRFLAAATLVFAASAAATVAGCASMGAMGGMPMPGGWTMSMTWMRMPGQTWGGAAAAFVAVWTVMMVAMMTPSLAPTLWRYRRAVGGTGCERPDRLVAAAGAGYVAVWAVPGAVVFALGAALAAATMRWSSAAQLVPFAGGVVVLAAGALQLTAWKARHLACSREVAWHGRSSPAGAGTAWRHGMRLGLHCILCCAGPMAVLLVLGVMDVRAMIVVTAAVTAERLASNGARVARGLGVAAVASGVFLIARGVGA